MARFPDPEQICETILKSSGHAAPLVDLPSVCALWPDLRVTEDDLEKEGYLIPLGVHGGELLLRRKDHPNRKKFTLAHELGHWVLSNLHNGKVRLGESRDRSLSFNLDHKRQTPEEVWCNKFAASLLIPLNDLFAYLTNTEHLVEKITEGARAFGVSEETFLLRVVDKTPVSIVEVVSHGAIWRTRRKYFSKLGPQDKLDEVSERVLGTLSDEIAPGVGPKNVDGYAVYRQQVNSTSKIQSMLVCFAPIGSI